MTEANVPALARKKCNPCEGGTPPLNETQQKVLVRDLDNWTIEGKELKKTFKFEDYHQTMAFVNATAWISHRENHHPDMEVGYNKVAMRYSTHAIGGLSENDFICAAKIDRLFGL